MSLDALTVSNRSLQAINSAWTHVGLDLSEAKPGIVGIQMISQLKVR